MPSPIRPNQIREAIASIDGDFCEKFIGSLQSPALFRDWYVSVFNDDGTLTDEFKAMVCGGTVGAGGDPVTPPVTPPVVTPPGPPVEPPPVTGLTPPALIASHGSTFIQLRWTPSPGATFFLIMRDGATVAQLPANQFALVDNVGVGRSHVYTVTAIDTLTNRPSATSNEAYGYTGPIVIGQPPRNT